MLPSFLGGMCAVQARAWDIARSNEGKREPQRQDNSCSRVGWLKHARTLIRKVEAAGGKWNGKLERQVST